MTQGDPKRTLGALLAYLAILSLGAALVSPGLWHLAQHLWPGSPIAQQPFHRYVNRSLLGFALVGLWPLLRALGADSWSTVGAQHPRRRLGDWALGLSFGWASLGVAALVVVGLGGRSWNPSGDAEAWVGHLARALSAALVVSLLEELLFRGAIFSALRRTGSFAWAAGLSSCLYAFLHFLQRPPSPEAITVTSGFSVLARMMGGFLEWDLLMPGWLTLVLAGWILSIARERTGHLAFGVGVHAGWIFWLKSYGFTTTASHPGVAGSLWGSGRLYDGWVATAILLLAGWILHRWLGHRTP